MGFAFHLLVLFLNGFAYARNEMKLVLFSEATVAATHARCLDGTPAGYYIKQPTNTSHDWVIHLEGVRAVAGKIIFDL